MSNANQPNQLIYSVSELYVFPLQTRAGFLAATGTQAPPFDTTKPIKEWFDPAPSTGQYKTVQGFALVPLVVDPATAAQVNLPGNYVYPPWNNPATTVAVVPGFGSLQPTPINASYLCELADAQAIATQIGVTGAPYQDPNNFNNVAWGTETRRAWMLATATGPVYAAQLCALAWTNGKGAPGSFDRTCTFWTPAPEPNYAALTQMPFPCRDLLPNEILIPDPTMMGMGQTVVERIDLLPAQSTSGTGLTAQQAAQLSQIASDTQAIRAFFRI